MNEQADPRQIKRTDSISEARAAGRQWVSPGEENECVWRTSVH